MAIDSPTSVEVFFVVVFVAFSPNLGDRVSVLGVCVLFSGIFGALVCVCGMCCFFG